MTHHCSHQTAEHCSPDFPCSSQRTYTRNSWDSAPWAAPHDCFLARSFFYWILGCLQDHVYPTPPELRV